MKNKHPDFITAHWQDLPETNTPEIALLGRSNVGKSSFINALIGRSRARISQTPGKTQTINGYHQQNYILVDLPGFGYARVGKAHRKEWQMMCENYLMNRPNLMGILHLVDIRHAWQNVDLDLAALIGATNIACQVILTKSDKQKKNDNVKMVNYYNKSLSGLYTKPTPVIMTSAKEKRGFDQINQLIHLWTDEFDIEK
ncbi:ribosome biogenesis GTP-binding protein YihA/YsxC [Gammaproteobacteria bacterium]|nr:ribosome biogenesis GTP-binding protein YihA/YsxC [Gammaproteobacteria bacterium]